VTTNNRQGLVWQSLPNLLGGLGAVVIWAVLTAVFRPGRLPTLSALGLGAGLIVSAATAVWVWRAHAPTKDAPDHRLRRNANRLAAKRQRFSTHTRLICLAVPVLFVAGIVWDLVPRGLDYRADIVVYSDEGYAQVLPEAYQPTKMQESLMSHMSGPRAFEQLASALRSSEGTDVGNIDIRLLLQNLDRSTIIVLDIYPIILNRNAALTGTFVDVPTQGGASNERMEFNLEERDPRAHSVDDNGKPTPALYFENRHIQLGVGETDIIVMGLAASRHSYLFDIGVDYRMKNTQRTAVIANNGQHFRITGYDCDPASKKPSYKRAFGLTITDYRYTISPLPAENTTASKCEL